MKEGKNLEIRRLSADEEAWLNEEERKTMYPFLEKKVLSRWYEAGYHIAFALMLDGQKIGAVSFDIYDFLKKGRDNYIILDTWNFFVKPEWQGKSCGRYLLERIVPMVKDYYLENYDFRVVQIIIESNTAPEFYEKVLPKLGYDYKKIEMTVIGEDIVYYFLNVE